MKNILNALIAELSQLEEAETDETREKIRSERRYFATIMSVHDFERFKNLESLHGEGHNTRYRNMFVRAFSLGVMFTALLTDNPLPPTERGVQHEQ